MTICNFSKISYSIIVTANLKIIKKFLNCLLEFCYLYKYFIIRYHLWYQKKKQFDIFITITQCSLYLLYYIRALKSNNARIFFFHISDNFYLLLVCLAKCLLICYIWYFSFLHTHFCFLRCKIYSTCIILAISLLKYI